MIPRLLLPILCLLLPGTLWAAETEARPLVVVTVPPQAYFVEQLAGDLVAVEVLLPPGTNHETYEPTIRQARALEQAALILTIGHPHFAVEQVLLKQERKRRAKTVRVSEGYPFQHDDIHLWTAPSAAKVLAANTAAALIGLDAGWKPKIDAALRQLIERIERLDADLKVQLAPHRGRTFLVFHPGWGYFAADFGLVQSSIEAEGKEPGPFQLTEIVKEGKRLGIAAIYLEPSFSRDSAEVVARELNARVELLDPMSGDWERNLRAATDVLVRGFLERPAR